MSDGRGGRDRGGELDGVEDAENLDVEELVEGHLVPLQPVSMLGPSRTTREQHAIHAPEPRHSRSAWPISSPY